jgi:hypothetical protein
MPTSPAGGHCPLAARRKAGRGLDRRIKRGEVETQRLFGAKASRRPGCNGPTGKAGEELSYISFSVA